MNKNVLTSQEIAGACKQLDLTDQDIFVVKPIFADDHDVYFAKDLKSLFDLLIMLRGNYDEKKSQFILQRASPHFSTCIKHHYYLDLQTFVFQSSMTKESFDKSLEPKFGLVARSWEKVDHVQEIDQSGTYKLLRKFVQLIRENWKQKYVGFDYVISEADSRIDVIDFNYNPAFSDINPRIQKNTMECYLTKKLIKKLNRQKIQNPSLLIGFSPKKLIQISQGTISVKFGLIDREFSISGYNGITEVQEIAGEFVVTDLDGQNQNMSQRAQCWWDEGYRGRVIRCSQVLDSAPSKEQLLFFLTNKTQNVPANRKIFWLEDDQMEEFFDFLRINDLVYINC